MVLLVLLYVVLAFALYVFFGGSAGFLIWGVLPIGMLWAQWYFSDTLAMKGMRAREVSPAEAPELHALVDRLCALADMKKPRVAISVSDVPNAFATGRSEDRAVVAVTTGLMRRLDEREIEAVLSHELSHVAHKDVTVMTIASAVGVLAGFMIRSAMWSSVGRRDQNGAVAFLALTLIGIVVYAVSFLLTRVLSRYRELSAARAGQAVTFTLSDEIDISRGDMLVRPEARPRIAEGLDARVVWMADSPLNPGRQYDLRFATASVSATPELIHHQIDVNTLEHHHVEQLSLNDIGLVRWRLSRPTAFDAYGEHRQTGAFTVIDRISNLTMGAGMIVRPVTDTLTDKSSNVVWHEHRIAKTQRAGQKSQRPAVLWFTGLSGAGKSSVANALEQALFQRGHHSYLLDGDNVRHGLNRDLGFTDEDRVENIRRIGEVAKLMADAGLVVLSAFISPFRADRDMVRELMEPGEFIEIHVRASLETCESRDPKGLYARARAGGIRNFTGIDSPYEEPDSPELVLDTERHGIEECVDLLLDYLKRRQILV